MRKPEGVPRFQSSSYNLVSRRLVLLFLSPFHLRYTFLPTYLITMADRAAP